ncbi:MAG: SDR family oxidoreductase, partial [Bacteroidota bacterium]
RFSGKFVLVTGGSRGIGKAIVEQFAAEGARVAFIFRQNAEAARALVQSLKSDQHLAIKVNIDDAKACQKLVDLLMEEFGRIDILVNNAGVYLPHPVDDTPFDDWLIQWNSTLQTNLTGAAQLSFLVAQQMIDQGSGRIINITSRGAFRGEPQHPGYAASKAGLNAFSQSLAQALGPHGIGVYAVAPGFVETEMAEEQLHGPNGDKIRNQSPFQRVATPAEVAHTVLFLAEEASLFLSGGILDVNGASYLRS